MTTRKKIDWSKPIRPKHNKGVAHIAHVSDETAVGVMNCPHDPEWYGCAWDAYGVADFGKAGPHSMFNVENVPEKFGRWVVITRFITTAFGTHGEAERQMAEVRAAGHEAFMQLCRGYDGDVIGGERG